MTDAKSIAAGYGPDCAEKRASFYAGGGFSVEEVDALAASESEDVRRYLRSFQRALRAGHVGNAELLLGTARKLARTATLPCAA